MTYDQYNHGLRFFGEMTASISHEFKNCLAIMNENAGLLQDLVLLAQKGKPLDTERTNRIAIQILRQIHRADQIVKNLNGFAHSVDHSQKSVDLGDTLQFALALGHRIAVNRGITLMPTFGPEKITFTTHPFFFIYLIWRCMDFAMKFVGESKIISIETGIKDDYVIIRFTGMDDAEDPMHADDFMEEASPLLATLNSDIHLNDKRNALHLSFPVKRNN